MFVVANEEDTVGHSSFALEHTQSARFFSLQIGDNL